MDILPVSRQVLWPNIFNEKFLHQIFIKFVHAKTFSWILILTFFVLIKTLMLEAEKNNYWISFNFFIFSEMNVPSYLLFYSF